MEKGIILAVYSSPRKISNSTLLAEEFLAGAEELGYKIDRADLKQLTIKHCLGCYSCEKPEASSCIIQDDMTAIYQKIKKADILLLATPVYYFTVSGMLKVFMDRCIAAQYLGFLKDKKLVTIMAYQDEDPFIAGCVNALRTFQDFARHTKMSLIHQIYGTAHIAGEILDKKELLTKARGAGRSL